YMQRIKEMAAVEKAMTPMYDNFSSIIQDIAK
ncbi:MAG: hypothetical protein K0S75_2961, partial [Clostridia bacterium]|nr:hypothetical protein [Clostridia bacterium]